MKYLKTVVIASIGFLALVSCDEKKEVEVGMEDKELTVAIADEMSEIQKRMEDFGDRINNEITKLDGKLEGASDEMKEELEEERKEWIEAREELSKRMENLSANAKDNWAEFKSDVQGWFDNIEDEFNS